MCQWLTTTRSSPPSIHSSLRFTSHKQRTKIKLKDPKMRSPTPRASCYQETQRSLPTTAPNPTDKISPTKSASSRHPVSRQITCATSSQSALPTTTRHYSSQAWLHMTSRMVPPGNPLSEKEALRIKRGRLESSTITQ